MTDLEETPQDTQANDPTHAALQAAIDEPATMQEQPVDPMHGQINHWFTYHAPTESQVVAMAYLRESARMLGHQIVAACPPSADRTTALRHLRDCVMTANASIVLGGQ